MKNCIVPLIIAVVFGYSVHELGSMMFDYYNPTSVNEIEIKVLEYSE